jgi:hypothetical protein
MKKRSKSKGVSIPKAISQQSLTFSSHTIIRNARTYPIVECLISASWQDEDAPGLVEVVVTREQPDGDLCFGVYLIDKYCLGLKNTFARVNYTRDRYEKEMKHHFTETRPLRCSPELAHQMIYGGIEYAAQFGFTPEKDFALSQYMLVLHGELREEYKITFGKDGKPFFIAGPYDDSAQIVAQLERTAGQDNYHFIAAIDPDMSF